MITADQAKRLTYHDHVHYGSCTRSIGPRGGIQERVEDYRVTGAVKVWKRDPEAFRVPIKFGLRGYGEIVPENAAQFHLPSECPLLADGAVTDKQHMARVQPCYVPILGQTKNNPGFWRPTVRLSQAASRAD